MKITKNGLLNKTVWVGACTQCGSEAEAFQDELKYITYDQRDGSSFSWEVCPVCKRKNMLFYKKRDQP